MSLSDFTNSMSSISVDSIADWCTICGSYSIFCPAFDDDINSSGGGRSTSHHSGLSPAVSGVIGAVVALFVAGLAFAALFLLAGCRVHRVPRGRRSELGGFKGAEKLASDRDLTLPKGGAGATVVQETPGTGAAAAAVGAPIRGHERVGSWELRDNSGAKGVEDIAPMGMGMGNAGIQALPRRPSYEDDDDRLNVNPYARGVKPDERV
jgi:hypothetical protein